jgi:hypothetical protein
MKSNERLAKELAGSRVIMDGRPAKVVGAKLKFAHVYTIDNGPELHAEYAWPTVKRLIDKGSEFKSY